MKKAIFTVVLLLIAATASAQIGKQPDREDRISNTLGFDPKNAIWGGKKDSNGERRNPAGLAFKGGANLNVDYWEFGLHLNTFQHINYYAIGLSFHREIMTVGLTNNDADSRSTLAVLMGAESQIAARYGLNLEGTRYAGVKEEHNAEYFNYSISTIIRWDRPFELPGYLEAQGTYTHRSDIKDLWGDNSDYGLFDNEGLYIKIGIYFIELFR